MSEGDVPTCERLTLRRMTADDLDDMARLLGDPAVMTHYPRPKTRPEALAWIEWNLANYARDGFGLWIMERDGEFLGDCGLTWQFVDGVEDLEVGYHLLPEHQGHGYAAEAAIACRDLAVRRGITRLIAVIRPGNRASERVAERAGLAFERDGVAHGLPVRVYAIDDPVAMFR